MTAPGCSRFSAPAFAVAVAMSVSTGCAHRTQRVEREMILPPSAPTHEVASHQRFLMAVPIADPDPAYPHGARFDGTLQVCTTFVVTAEGAVEDVAFDAASPGCAGPGTPASAPFEHAARAALAQWRYFGAAVCSFPDGRDPDADPRCEGPDVRVDPVPIRLRYVFTFSSARGGRVARAPAPPVR